MLPKAAAGHSARCCPLQVASTEGIEVGQWVRFYALAASPARRRLAQAQSIASNSSSAGIAITGAAASKVRPLPPGLRNAMALARQDCEAETAPAGVSAAALAGTLDAVRQPGWVAISQAHVGGQAVPACVQLCC